MNFRPVLFLLLCVVFIVSCKKQSDNVFLSNEGTLGFDGYSFTDSLTLFTSSIREDSLKTDSLSHNLIGVVNDPLFGRYEAFSCFQFGLPQLNNVIKTETMDSMVLFMQFTSSTAYYGDLNSVSTFTVYELGESMNSGVAYSNQSYAYDVNKPLGTYTGKLHLSDSLNITELGNKVKVAPGISITLDTAFARKIFNADNSNLSSTSNFIQFFKGLVIVPTSNPNPGSGVIAAFNMKASASKLRIYYNGNQQSDFVVLDGTRRFTGYKFSSQNPEFIKQKSFPKGDFDTCFIQAMGGGKTHIRLPYLFSLIKNKDKKISVGKAEIIFRPVQGSYTSPFSLPTRLLLLQPHPDNNLNAGIIDLLEPFYGGSYNAVSNEYRFNITRHIQSIFSDYQLRGKDNNRGLFLLTPSDFPIAPSRILLDTRKGLANTGIEFKLIYTEL